MNDWYAERKDAIYAHLRNLGYNLINVGGVQNMVLASDHPLHKTRVPLKPWEEFNVDELLGQLHANTLQEFVSEANYWAALYRLANYFNEHGQSLQAFALLQEGQQLTLPNKYVHLFDESMAKTAFYLREKRVGADAVERIVLNHHIHFDIRNNVMDHLGHYAERVPLQKICDIKHAEWDKYYESSASIIALPEGYRVNVRKVNYRIGPQGNYIYDGGAVRTRNYLLALDGNFRKTGALPLRDDSGLKLYPTKEGRTPILGMEDLRLFGDRFFFCTYLEMNADSHPQIGWGTYEPDTGSVTRMVPLPGRSNCEKNWLPFMLGNDIYYLYAIGPVRLYKLNQETGEGVLEKTLHYTSTKQYSPCTESDFRGSAPPIPYKDGWLLTVHQVVYKTPRKYYTRFVWFSADFQVMRYSRLFIFERVGIEFNLSMCHSPHGLVMSYSVNDGSSTLGLVSYTTVDELLANAEYTALAAEEQSS